MAEPRPQALKAAPAKASPKPPAPKRKSISFSAVLCIFLLLFIPAFAALVYFDIGGLKAPVAGAQRLDVPTQAQMDEAEAAQLTLNQQKQQLDAAAREQASRDRELSGREEQAAEQEAALAERQAALDALEARLGRQQADEEALVAVFAQMNAARAAAVLAAQRDVADIAWVLSRMEPAQAAKIMNQFDTEVAARVAARMIETGTNQPES
jgi:flagellar motility protein MotE (MotC chaperone)